MTFPSHQSSPEQSGRLVLNTISANRGPQARRRKSIPRHDSFFALEDTSNKLDDTTVKDTMTEVPIRDIVVAFEDGPKPHICFVRIANNKPFADAIFEFRRETANDSDGVCFMYNHTPVFPNQTPLALNANETLFVLKVVDWYKKSTKRKRTEEE